MLVNILTGLGSIPNPGNIYRLPTEVVCSSNAGAGSVCSLVYGFLWLCTATRLPKLKVSLVQVVRSSPLVHSSSPCRDESRPWSSPDASCRSCLHQHHQLLKGLPRILPTCTAALTVLYILAISCTTPSRRYNASTACGQGIHSSDDSTA